MAKTSLTDLTIQKLPVPDQGQVTFWDTNPKSFGIRVSQGGSKTFVIKKDGKLVSLGRYPSVTLKNARSEAKRLLADFHTTPGLRATS